MGKEKPSLKDNVKNYGGYAIGVLQDSIPYNFINIYLLFFLTDLVGLSPAAGGTIILLATVTNAVATPLIGYISDNCNSKNGKRRPFMIGAILPILLTTILIFAPYDVPDSFKFPYYLFATILFWIAFTSYSIPFNSFGSSIATETNARNNLRSICGIFVYSSVWIASSGPKIMQVYFEGTNISERMQWFYPAIIFATIAAIGAYVSWKLTKDKDINENSHIKKKREPLRVIIQKIIKSYWQLLKTRVVRSITFIGFIFNVFFAVKVTAFVYLMTYNLNLSNSQQAIFWTISTASSFCVIPVLNAIANRLSKRATFIMMWSLMAVFALVFLIVQIQSFSVLIMYQIAFALANVCFWVIGLSLLYDCNEVVEFETGENKAGGIMGLFSFCQTAGYAIGAWIAGVALSLIGYDASAAYDPSVATGINTLLTATPIILMTIGIIVMIRFPLNKEKHRKLSKALELKKAGKEYSTEGFEDIF